MAEKERADVALVKRGLCESREKAQANIMAGLVYIGERKVLKASDPVKPEDELLVRGKANPFVSRGGLKLEKAIAAFDGNVAGKVCLDIGAAAGGFTDVLLKNGAAHVYAIDVGYGQFDWGLRNDPRVTLMERTNARYLTAEQFPMHPTMAVMDVSFISIKLILPVAAAIMGERGCFYTLVKPQFEAGRERVGKKGVVRDPQVHLDVLMDIVNFAPSFGWRVCQLDYSPITGPEGNIEFLAHIRPAQEGLDQVTEAQAAALVSRAHAALKKRSE